MYPALFLSFSPFLCTYLYICLSMCLSPSLPIDTVLPFTAPMLLYTSRMTIARVWADWLRKTLRTNPEQGIHFLLAGWAENIIWLDKRKKSLFHSTLSYWKLKQKTHTRHVFAFCLETEVALLISVVFRANSNRFNFLLFRLAKWTIGFFLLSACRFSKV